MCVRACVRVCVCMHVCALVCVCFNFDDQAVVLIIFITMSPLTPTSITYVCEIEWRVRSASVYEDIQFPQ